MIANLYAQPTPLLWAGTPTAPTPSAQSGVVSDDQQTFVTDDANPIVTDR